MQSIIEGVGEACMVWGGKVLSCGHIDGILHDDVLSLLLLLSYESKFGCLFSLELLCPRWY